MPLSDLVAEHRRREHHEDAAPEDLYRHDQRLGRSDGGGGADEVRGVGEAGAGEGTQAVSK